MSAMLEDIAGYVQTEGHGTAATDLFISWRPDAPDLVTTLYEYMGEPRHVMNREGSPPVVVPRLQVIVRGTARDYLTARAKIDAIYKSLHEIVDMTLGTNYYASVIAIDTPFQMGRDENQRHLLACNFSVWMSPS